MSSDPTDAFVAALPEKNGPGHMKTVQADDASCPPEGQSDPTRSRRKRGRPRKSLEATNAAAPPNSSAAAGLHQNQDAPSQFPVYPGSTANPIPQTAPSQPPAAVPAPAPEPSYSNGAVSAQHGSEHPTPAPQEAQNRDSQNQVHLTASGAALQSGQKRFKARRFFKRGRFKQFKNRHSQEGPSADPNGGRPGVSPNQSSPEFDTQESEADQAPLVDKEVETFACEGVLELSGKGFGFLRERGRAYQQHPEDVFVTPELVRRHGLRDGMMLSGRYRRSGRGPQMVALEAINRGAPDRFKVAPLFEELTALNPEKRIVLETVPDRHTTRVIDLISPIGMGQRGLIVAPPRTGKTTLLMHIAEAVMANHPEVHLLVLLVDERPEEVTEFKINLPQAELWASSNDSDVKSHTRIAQLCLERAKRMVEDGQDVFLILDSITRVGRAFNNAMQGSGRTLSGGMDARGMEIPRRLFAAARNTEEAGSLTIVATALIETGSRMDELIFQEFKGTGNMELVLDRRIAEQRVYPAVDIFKSGTRREELIVPEAHLDKISVIRRGLAGHKPIEAIERLLFFIRKFPTNEAMLKGIPG